MKTILKFNLLMLFCLALFSFSQTSAQSVKDLLLQANNTNISKEMLAESARIMNDRLITFGVKANVTPYPEKARIVVQLPDNVSEPEITQLLTAKGIFGIYETLTLSEIKEDILKSKPGLKDDFRADPSDARIGSSVIQDPKIVGTIRDYLEKNNLSEHAIILWSRPGNDFRTSVYILKTESSGNPSLKGSDIESVSSVHDENSQFYRIRIKFTGQAAKALSALTRRSLEKPIAIVIDDLVYYAPVVKSPIDGGESEITGNLSEKESGYLIAILKNGPLPADFTVK